MRRIVVLISVAIMIGGAVASASFHSERRALEPNRQGLEAAEGTASEPTVIPGTFHNSFVPHGACGTDTIPVTAGMTSIAVVVNATVPTNDIALTLLDPSGASVGSSDAVTSPEAVEYSAASLATGNWTAKVCNSPTPAVDAFVEPYTYDGSYTISNTPLPSTAVLPLPGVPTASAGTPAPTYAAGRLVFAPETIIDPQRTEGEPVSFFAPDGSYWESGPFGTSTQQSWVHRSTDGGLEFHAVSPFGVRPDLPPGGGDTDVVVDDQGFAYFSDLEGLANVSASVSNDGGNSWRKQALAAQEAGVDRQWYSVDDGATAAASDNTVFLDYRQIPGGSQILSSPGSTGGTDPVGGLVWTNAASAGRLISNGAPCGKLVFDPVNRNLYLPCGQTGANPTDHIELVVGHVNPGQRTGIDFKSYELPASPGGGAVNTVFPWVGVDKGGNLMAVWVDRNDRQVYETVSTDQGTSWMTPVKVNTGAARTNTFPEVAGGPAGTFAIAWYGSDSSLDSDHQPPNTAPNSSDFPWYGYVAVVSNATSTTPTIAQQPFTEHPMHYGMVCNSGTTCTSGRTMADYFDVGYDQQGMIRLVFDDESSQYRQAHLFEARQLSTAAPKSPVADATGDAQSPHYAPMGAGANLPQLDFTKLAVSQPTKGIARVQMTLASLASLAPPAGKTSIVWLTRFQAQSVMTNGATAYRIFYVGAKSTNGGKPTFFTGSGDDPTGCLDASSGCKVLIYPVENAITSGAVKGTTITIDVSLKRGFGAGAAREVDGPTLYSVTALSYGENADADLYAEGDATHAFDYGLGGVPKAVPQPTAPPR
ncbi:MAG: hypothetical protein V7644_693 [Actinomycetota bacterium]